MKVVFTIAKKEVKNKQITGVGTQELVSTNVSSFKFDEGSQTIFIDYNGEPSTEIKLMQGNDEKMEQWFLANITVFQVPLKVKL